MPEGQLPAPILLAIVIFFVLLIHSGNTCYIDEYGNFTGTKFERQIGTQKTFPYTKFLGIDPGDRNCLIGIYLELVEFDPNYLVDQLEGCENLKYLTLENTHWKKKSFTKKAHLPNLVDFNLQLINWDFRSSSAEEFLSFFFVYKHPVQNYNENYSIDKPRPVQNYSLTEFIPSFNFDSDINLETGVGVILILKYNKDYMIINNLPFDISSHFQFDSLNLFNTVLNVSSLKEIKTKLFSSNVKMISGRISDVFAKSSNAHSLHFGLLESTEKESIDLAELPSNLSEFGISFGLIWNSIPNLQLSSLTKLTLKHSELNLTLMPKFTKLNELTLTNVTSVGDSNNMMSFIKDNEHLQSVTIDGLNTLDLSALEPSRGTLEDLSIQNTPVTQSVEPSQLNNPAHCTLQLYNSVFDVPALTRFPKTFTNLRTLYIMGDFEYLSSLLLVVVETRVEKINIFLRGDQRARNRPEFEKTVGFLNKQGVPPYATSIILARHYAAPERWESQGLKDDYTQNPYLRDLAIYSYTVPLLLICIIGILGNLVSGVVLMSKEMRGSNSYILLGLTVSDAVVLVTYISSILYFGVKFIFMFWDFNIPEFEFPLFWLEISLASAQVSDNLQSLYLYPINKTAYTGSVYMTVLVTLERYVAVCWPLRSKRILTTKKAVVGIVAVLALSIILNTPRWLEAQTNTVEEVVSTFPSPIRWKLNRNTASTDLLLYAAYREFYHGWIWVTMMYGIPIPLLIGLNLKIWIQLKHRMDNQEALRCSRDQHSSGEELASLTKTLICISSIFILCNIINGVVTLLILLYNPGDWEPADIEIFSCIPLIINSSVNFVIYCAMGTKFSGVLLNLLRRYCRVVCWNQSCSQFKNSHVRSSQPNPTIQNAAIEMRGR